MIDGAVVYFANGDDVSAERVTFKEGGWIGVRADDGWIYYPPHAVDSVASRDDG